MILFSVQVKSPKFALCLTLYKTIIKGLVEVLKMKPRPIINAPENEISFQIDENDNPPNLVDIDVEDDVDIDPEEENDTDDNVDKEVDAIDGGYGEESHDGLLDEDDDNVDDDDDDYFTASLFI